jgi:STE24 endopeptidase
MRSPRIVAVLAVVLAVAGVAVTLLRPTAPAVGAVTTDLDAFAPSLLDAVRVYRSPRLTAALVNIVIGVAVPVALVCSPRGRRIVARLAGPDDGASLRRVLVGAAAVGGVLWAGRELAQLPLRAVVGLVHDGRWRVRTGSAADWWRDRLVEIVLEVLLAALLGAVLVALARRLPRTWHWHPVWLVTALTFVAVTIWPVAIAPLLQREVPLPEGPVADEIRRVLGEAGLDDVRLVVAEESAASNRINAEVTGIGPTRTVVIWDTLLDLSPEHVGLVVAHEVAHREHRDLERGALGAAALLLPFAWLLGRATRDARLRRWVGARSAGDPRLVALGIVLFVAVRLVADPVALWQSRRVEAAADHRALELSGRPDLVVGLQREFVVRNLSPVDRPTWQHVLVSTHPSPGERIRAAVAHADRSGIELPPRADYEDAEASISVPWRRP